MGWGRKCSAQSSASHVLHASLPISRVPFGSSPTRFGTSPLRSGTSPTPLGTSPLLSRSFPVQPGSSQIRFALFITASGKLRLLLLVVKEDLYRHICWERRHISKALLCQGRTTNVYDDHPSWALFGRGIVNVPSVNQHMGKSCAFHISLSRFWRGLGRVP